MQLWVKCNVFVFVNCLHQHKDKAIGSRTHGYNIVSFCRGQFEYELVLKTDVFTKRHTQWYYFRVRNMVPGVIYKFRIVNLLKRDSLYNHGKQSIKVHSCSCLFL